MNKKYSIGEEIANSISHGAGALLSAVGIGILVTLSALYGTTTTVISSLIYGFTLFFMYLSSTLYHSFQNEKLKKIFKTIDHCSIFLLIAGTYTPFTLITLKGTVGYTLFAIIWIFAIFGIAINIIDVKKYHKLSLICHVIMGWSVVFTIKPLILNLSREGLILLVLGGLCYTVGIGFYLAKRTPYMHMVWHFFVLFGSIFHFLSVVLYVI